MTTCSTKDCPKEPFIKSTGECRCCYYRRRYHENPTVRKRLIAKSTAHHRRKRLERQAELERLRRYEKGVEAWIHSIETLGDDVDRLYSADLRAAIEAHK